MFLWLKVFGFKSQVQRGHEQVEVLVGKAHHLAGDGHGLPSPE